MLAAMCRGTQMRNSGRACSGALGRNIACSTIVWSTLISGAIARDVTYSVTKGKRIQIGPWYEMSYPSPCQQIGVAHLKILRSPTLGTLVPRPHRGPAVRPDQVGACPNLVLDRLEVIYTAKKVGDDQFQFLVDYDPAIPGDWIYNVTVHTVP